STTSAARPPNIQDELPVSLPVPVAGSRTTGCAVGAGVAVRTGVAVAAGVAVRVAVAAGVAVRVGVAVGVGVAAWAVRLSETNAPVWKVPVCVARAEPIVNVTVAPS